MSCEGVESQQNQSLKIAVIGGGWYGCYITKYLYETGGYHNITLFEKDNLLINGTSGQAFNRMHVGPHYPRCKETREQVQKNFIQFSKEFCDLIIPHVNSFYALGTSDAESKPSLVSSNQFKRVCYERSDCISMPVWSVFKQHHIKVNSDTKNLFCDDTIYRMNEPALYYVKSRNYFNKLFKSYNIQIMLGTQVMSVESMKSINSVNKQTRVSFQAIGQTNANTKGPENQALRSDLFDFVINCTYYTDFLSKQLCFKSTEGAKEVKNMVPKFVYEPCISLLYEPPQEWRYTDKNLWSFTVMDGGFPCIMPYCTDLGEDYIENGEKSKNINDDIVGEGKGEGKNKFDTKYVLYHAHYSKLAKFSTHKAAADYVKEFCENKENYDIIDDDDNPLNGSTATSKLKLINDIESDFSRYITDFKKDFKYVGYNVLIRTKLDTTSEFRANFVWQDAQNSGLIQIFSGKITNCINAAPIVLSIIQRESNTCPGEGQV